MWPHRVLERRDQLASASPGVPGPAPARPEAWPACVLSAAVLGGAGGRQQQPRPSGPAAGGRSLWRRCCSSGRALRMVLGQLLLSGWAGA